MKRLPGLLAAIALAAIAIQPSFADEHGHRGFERERQGEQERHFERERHWGGDIHRFHERDLHYWRGGQWYNGRHDGRRGWWWIVGGLWYYYPAPVYPYPDPYRPPIVVTPPPAPQQQYWYYCANPQGYYPYVARCAMPWQPVPAAPRP